MTTRVIQRTPDLALKIRLPPAAQTPAACAPAIVLDSEGAELARLGCGETYTVEASSGAGGCPCTPSLIWMRPVPWDSDGNPDPDVTYIQYRRPGGGALIDWQADAPVTGGIEWNANTDPAASEYGYELWVAVVGAHAAATILWSYDWSGGGYYGDLRPHNEIYDPVTWETISQAPTATAVHSSFEGVLTITATVDGVPLAPLTLTVIGWDSQ